MRGGQRVAVVIPARNEERLLPGVLDGLPAWVDGIIVVDDGSTDATRQVAANWPDPRRRVVCLTPSRGVGAAILAGYAEALLMCADVAVVVAGDGQMASGEMARVIGPLLRGEAEYVQGTRFPNARLRGHMPRLRRIGNRILSRLTSWVAGRPVSDSQCGYTAATREFLESAVRLPLPPGYGFPAFLRVHAHVRGWRVAECPVTAIYGDEVSGIRLWRDPAAIVWRLLRLAWVFRRGGRGGSRRPAPSAAKSPSLRRAT